MTAIIVIIFGMMYFGFMPTTNKTMTVKRRVQKTIKILGYKYSLPKWRMFAPA